MKRAIEVTITILIVLLLAGLTNAGINDPFCFGNITTDTACIGGTEGIVNSTGPIKTDDEFCIGTSCVSDWTNINGSGDGNNYTTNVSVDGTINKKITITVLGRSDVTDNFTDINTYNTSDEMRDAINISAFYQIKVDWSNILNKFITAVSGGYLYMDETTLRFNTTLLNLNFYNKTFVYNKTEVYNQSETDVLLAAKYDLSNPFNFDNTSNKTYVDAGLTLKYDASNPFEFFNESTVWGGDLGGTGSNPTVDDDSHKHSSTTVTIAGENVTSGTVADARIASTIARDSEVTAANTAQNISINNKIDANNDSVTSSLLNKLSKLGDFFDEQLTQYIFSHLNTSQIPGQNLPQLSFKSNQSQAGLTLSVLNDEDVGVNLFAVGTKFNTTGIFGVVENGSGLASVNTDLRFVVQELGRSFIFQRWNGSGLETAMTLREDGNLLLTNDLFLEDRNKMIKTLTVNGGSSMVFQSDEVLVVGGFPFMRISKDSNNVTIVTSWDQNSRNNSFSGRMNSFGPVPKSWIIENNATTLDVNLDFMFNVSDYIKYCVWLQSNMSLVPTGCKFFADTAGRGVPLLHGGDLEIHREAKIHEGLVLEGYIDHTGQADFSMEGNDFNIFNGSQHIFTPVIFESGFSLGEDITKLSAVFQGSISPFVNDQVDLGNWQSVNAPGLCSSDQCAQADGVESGVVSMSVNFNTLDVNNTRLTFVYSIVNLIGSNVFTVDLDNGTGPVEIFSDTGTDSLVEVDLDILAVNSSSVNLTFTCQSSFSIRPCYVDSVKVNGTATKNTVSNVSGFDSVFKMSDGAVDGDDFPVIGMYYDSSEGTLFIKAPIVNITGVVGISGGITGSLSAGKVPKAASASSLTDSNIADDGSSVSVSSDFAVDINVLVADAGTNNVGIGTTTPSQKLEVAGNVNISNNNVTARCWLSPDGDSDWCFV